MIWKKKALVIMLGLIMFLLPLIAEFEYSDAKEGEFGGGKGTFYDPYVIEDLEDLANISANLGAHYVLKKDIDASATSNWNSGAGFIPIGNDSNPFKGTLDGKRFNITGLIINRPSSDDIGMFGVLDKNSEVRNLSILNADIIGRDRVGILAGVNTGTVFNCHTTGFVKGYDGTGGICGRITGTISRSRSSSTVQGNNYVGGAIGSSSYGEVSDIIATGNVKGTDHVGGLVGRITGTLSKSCAMGTVTATGNFIGGFVGYNHGFVYNSHSHGKATGNRYVGGFAGYNYRYYGSEGLIEKSYSTGKPTASQNVGGLIGYNSKGVVSNSFWDTTTSSMTTSSGGTGKTTSEMKTKSTFTNVGWDFNDIWWITETKTYPLLFYQDNEKPKAVAGPDQMINEGESVIFNGSSSTDNLGIAKYIWTFKDNVDIILFGSKTEYLFNNPGIFIVTLEVIDHGDNFHRDHLIVTVNDTTPPVADAGPDLIVDEDTIMMFNGSLSYDNYRIESYTWTFTDGLPVYLVGVKPSYIFKEPGLYHVTLTVADPAGHLDTDTMIVNVNDKTPPIADAGEDIISGVGSIITFNGSKSRDNVGLINYTWNFFDVESVTLYGVSPRYIFNVIGQYFITLNVTDTAGFWSIDNVNVTIHEVIPPIAVAGPNVVIGIRDVMIFDGSGSSDNIEIVNYTWTFFDTVNVTLYGINPEYKFNNIGVFTVTLNVSDFWANWNTDTITITVADLTAPTARAGDDMIIPEGWTLLFSGGNSYDNVGIVNYTWTFFDGELIKLYGIETTYLFINPGLFIITLNVSDDAGNWNTDTITVVVEDKTAPKAYAGSDQTILLGTLLIFNGSVSYDNVGIINYTWTFKYDNIQVILYGITPSFTFNTPGVYTVKLTVLDLAEQQDSDTITITVEDNSPPMANAGPDRKVVKGTLIYLDGSLSNDNHDISKYVWTFTYRGIKKTLEGENTSFIFDDPGYYKIELNVTDPSGNYDIDELLLTVVAGGTVKGWVMDDSKKPIYDATIEIIASDGNLYKNNTDENGYFEIDIPEGEFNWRIVKSGFITTSGNSIVSLFQDVELEKQTLSREKKSRLLPILIIVIALLIFIIIAIIVFLAIIKKKNVYQNDKNISETANDDNVEKSSIIEDPFSKADRLRNICNSNNIQTTIYETNYRMAMQYKNMKMDQIAIQFIDKYNSSIESIIISKGISVDATPALESSIETQLKDNISISQNPTISEIKEKPDTK